MFIVTMILISSIFFCFFIRVPSLSLLNPSIIACYLIFPLAPLMYIIVHLKYLSAIPTSLSNPRLILMIVSSLWILCIFFSEARHVELSNNRSLIWRFMLICIKTVLCFCCSYRYQSFNFFFSPSWICALQHFHLLSTAIILDTSWHCSKMSERENSIYPQLNISILLDQSQGLDHVKCFLLILPTDPHYCLTWLQHLQPFSLWSWFLLTMLFVLWCFVFSS